MNNKITLTVLAVAFMFILTDSVNGDSIWAKRNKSASTIYADDVARQVGDILTINISENSSVDNSTTRDLSKQTDRSSSFNGEIGNIADIGDFGMSAESDNELTSQADYSDERTFEDSITVVVVDILPNGNLIVAGQRERNIAGDTQTIEVSGIVRPSDISFDNTVNSQQVAELKLMNKSEGISSPYTKPGWLGRILDIIWPF